LQFIIDILLLINNLINLLTIQHTWWRWLHHRHPIW